MMEKLKAWFSAHPLHLGGVLGAVLGLLAAILMACTSAGQPSPKLVAAEADLCIARVDWQVVAAVAGGALDPAPGTPRAKLEAAEDALCAARAASSPPAGSSPLPSTTKPDASP